MSPSEVLCNWIQRVLSFEIESKQRPSQLYQIIIGNIPPYNCVLDKNYNLTTRTLICRIPGKYQDFIRPSEDEKKAASTYHVYYSIGLRH